MWVLLTKGMALGLSATAAPGPLQAFLLSRAMERGARGTLPAALAPLITDGPIIALVLLVLSQTPEWLRDGLRLAGGGLMVWLAAGLLRAPRRPPEPDNLSGAGRRSLGEAVLLNALNPSPYIFWGLVGGPVIMEAWSRSAGHALSFAGGFYGAFVASQAGFILLSAAMGGLSSRIRRWLMVVSGAALAGFGIHQIVSVARGMW
ncbi:MAG: LysE family translocator [Desulfatibacillaceae bacterium]